MDCVALPCRLVGEQALFLVCSSVYWWGEIQLSRLGILFCSSALSCIVGSTLAAATQLTHRKGCSVSPVQKFVHGLLPGHIPVSGGVYTSVILYVLIISMDVVPLTRSYTASDGHVPLKFFLIFLGVRSLPHTPPPSDASVHPPRFLVPPSFVCRFVVVANQAAHLAPIFPPKLTPPFAPARRMQLSSQSARPRSNPLRREQNSKNQRRSKRRSWQGITIYTSGGR